VRKKHASGVLSPLRLPISPSRPFFLTAFQYFIALASRLANEIESIAKADVAKRGCKFLHLDSTST
jgi:hypothetical protein